ncbi:MAG: HEAT repeat domain-containing protein [Planctomycetes bacterium]|nr:HEAT repeat domain-containing protein [Planctomycetota bacterium]
MHKRLSRLGLWSALMAVLVLGISVPAFGGEKKLSEKEKAAKQKAAKKQAETDKLSKLLQKGVRHYQKQEYEEAKKTFDKLLKADITSQVGLELRKQAELGSIAKMVGAKDEELSQAAEHVLEMLNEAVRANKRKIDNAEELIAGFRSKDVKAYIKARARFLAHDEWSVPHLLDLLRDKKENNERVVARAISTLSDIGANATLPLVSALQIKNNLVKTRVTATLGQIADSRAVPALLAITENKSTPGHLEEAAIKALRNITGKTPKSAGSAVGKYQQLLKYYLAEKTSVVGNTFGRHKPVWSWQKSTDDKPGKLVYELVPHYLYFQRQGTEIALKSLELAPDNLELQSLLVALLSRQVRLVRTYIEKGPEDMKKEARGYRETLKKRVPVVCHLYGSAAVGRALEHTMHVRDGSASLILVKMLGTKMGLSNAHVTRALRGALHFSDKNLRYQAAVEAVKGSPEGTLLDADRVMQVLSAALKRISRRTVLIVSDNNQIKNKLAKALENQKVATAGAKTDSVSINAALKLMPAVDAVFVHANVAPGRFQDAYQKITQDGRTKSVPLFLIVDSQKDSPDLAPYKKVNAIIAPAKIREKSVGDLLDNTLAEAEVFSGKERAEIVLRAVKALEQVDPDNTRYRLSMTEPALVSALTSKQPEITLRAIRNLAAFGSISTLKPLAQQVEREWDEEASESEETKGESGRAEEKDTVNINAAACYAIAEILQRTKEHPPQDVLDVLRKALEAEQQSVREGAAEALSISGLEGKEVRLLVGNTLSKAETAENDE